ncbi:hypothetical protein [Catellicoccus marimammalium]|uniref:Capsular polysaccharide biosynthesis protein CpsC n=1 Tax=Catellicoccus marimammalium M35/04/3 TaxID=1234409 RepID=K8ZB40_9ENTE|nr:hypothetical protein [Catellicoccus marimammalium]EKU27262.1 hypothetical protein C683_0593 [Catellicoccus marimammalium M35/04/3]
MQKQQKKKGQFLFWILFLGIIGVGISGIYTYWICPKEYQSTATMRIELSKDQEESVAQDKKMQQSLEDNFQAIAKNKEILAMTKKQMSKDFQPSISTLQKEIHVSLEDNGKELSFRAQSSNPLWAQDELQAMGKTWMEVLPQKLKIQGLHWVKDPTFSPKPIQPNVPLQLGIGAIIGVILGAMIGLLLRLGQRKKKYVQHRYLQTLSAPVIGSIPTLTEVTQKPMYQKEGERQVEEHNAMVDERLLGETQHLETLTRSRRKRKR